jgi:hypothetical protein
MRQIAAPIAPLPPVTNARFNSSPFCFAHYYIHAQCYASRMRLRPRRQDTRTICLQPDDLMQSPVHQTEALLFFTLLELVAVIVTALRAWLESTRDGGATADGEN